MMGAGGLPMRFYRKHATLATNAFFMLSLSISSLSQNQTIDRSRTSGYSVGYSITDDDLRRSAQGHYPNSPSGASPFAPARTNFDAVFDTARRQQEQSATYRETAERQRLRAAQEEAMRTREAQCCWQRSEAPPHADPDAPDQAELLRNSKDRDFILRNFRTMYVDARNARYFGSDQLKAALGKNKDFEKLNVRIVDDPRVADAVLKVGYTFAWDYPFELRHQNTTIVLLAGKGEGPFSGPLGAANVARNFVNAAKSWREVKKASGK
jgi:hypothetical protein